MADIQRCHVALNNARLRGRCTAAALAAKRVAEESRAGAIVEFTRVQQETLQEVKGARGDIQAVGLDVQAIRQDLAPVLKSLGLDGSQNSQELRAQELLIRRQRIDKQTTEKEARLKEKQEKLKGKEKDARPKEKVVEREAEPPQ
jgi:hypothetical protein